MCAEKANIPHKQLWGRDKQRKCNFCTEKPFFFSSIGKSTKINTNQWPVAPLIFSAGGRNNIVYSSELLLVWKSKRYNKNNIAAMYIPYCINVIFLIVIFQFPFCGKASNANNVATWKKIKTIQAGPSSRLSWGFQLHEKARIWIVTCSLQASFLVGSDLKPKNAKKGTDNGFPPAAKITCRYM